MRVLIHKNYENLSRWTARYIIQRINNFAPDKKKPFVLGLPTGSTSLGVYQQLIAAYKAKNVSFSHVVTFNMDEYLGLEAEHPQSYHYFMKSNFFNFVDIPPENTHIPDGMATDPEEECRSYEAAIREAGGVEIFLGGIGVNGHIAFNEPGASLSSRTMAATLNHETINANARFFSGDIKKVPARAFTVGIGTIMEAREVIILASGRQKARALQAAIEGAVSHWCPVSCLQLHPKAIIVCDEDAAEELKYGTVRNFKQLESSEIKMAEIEV